MEFQALEFARKAVEGLDCLVSFSGGKESLVILDLAFRYGKRIEAFQMQLLEGLEYYEAPIREAEARYPGLHVKRYPHWLRSTLQREGSYCFGSDSPLITLTDIHAVARADSGIPLIVSGMCKRDSTVWLRRHREKQLLERPDLYSAPVWGWSVLDVLAYLRLRKIPIPEKSGKTSSGLDLSPEAVLYLHDRFPADYEKLHRAFPFVGAIEARRRWHGIGPVYSGEAFEAAQAARRAGKASA